VIPSMIYDATNSYSSLFSSCGRDLEGITGEALYPNARDNRRLGEREFMMPVLYPMAVHLCAVQRDALREGNCLVLYEGYRPHETQVRVSTALKALVREDEAVKEGVTSAPWSASWFIAMGYSNHQRGYAVDVSLARLDGEEAVEERTTGGCRYIRTRKYRLYEMPTAMHELSRAAASFEKPAAGGTWKSVRPAETMNETALGLQAYCTGRGLTPLASEWWHFDDPGARSMVGDKRGVGDFVIRENRSEAP